MQEVWKPVKGYEGMYEVSNKGNVKSVPREYINKVGARRTVKGQMLRFFKTKEGYVRISLGINQKQKNYLVHRLVAETFLDNPDGKNEVNHKDANKENNAVDNLEWCTRVDNIRHSFANNLVFRDKGTERYNSKLDENKVREMRRLFETGNYRISEVARMFSVNRKTADNAIKKVTWQHVD
ncbi:NUMOD4 domain-containing protein [Priestia filamentosa]|uniref:NUMOD4 domain-containing protein n=1 Tax=Priestia filamentosa TaxID=1402861 RepID=UPI003983BF57